MERHDTHILSDSEEDDEINESKHFYYFNDSNDNSENSSNKNSIYSNSKKHDPFKINDLKPINNSEKDILDESLISSKDLEDMFYNENRYTKPTNHSRLKDTNKKKNNIINNNKNDNKINNNNENKEEKKVIKRTEINIDDDNNNKVGIKKVQDNIKIKLIKLNFDEDNISNSHKYQTSMSNLLIKKSEIKRKCVSLSNILKTKKITLKSGKKENKEKNEKIKKQNKKEKGPKKEPKKKKILNLLPQPDSKSNSNTNKSNHSSKIEQKNVTNLFDLLKNKNIKSLKISKDSFNIINKKSNSLEVKMQNFKKGSISTNSYIYQINKQNDFYLKQDYELNMFKKEYFSPAKIKINGIKRFEILQSKKEDNKYNEYNSKFIMTNNNNSQYSFRYHNNSSTNYNHNKYIQKRYEDEYNNEYNDDYNNPYHFDYNDDITRHYIKNYNYNQDYISCMNRIKRMNKNGPNQNIKQNSGINLRGDKKIKILYDLYCKRPNKENKNIPRINSAHTIKDANLGNKINQNAFNFIDLNGNYENRDRMIQNRLYNNNSNKNWLFKLMKVQKEKNLYHYEKHFGNNENCPLCQQMDKKNEEQIKKIGIYHISSEQKNMEIRKTSKKRRINSAFPNHYTKINKVDLFDKKDLVNETRNNLNYNKSTALFNEYNINRRFANNNQKQRKLQLNKGKYLNSNYS